ncbi:MAG: CpXC domain-containing protein [Chloroflexi bacterium]|nr:CpXC domain-containing protein [Chloroflexota bacterium]MCC6896455.1 CpXC domain-containing protein [Anaerolineae bacterium]
MPKTIQTTIQCVQCRQPIRATIQSVIDPAENPQAKIALLGGNINMVQCPNCGAPNTVLAPILYHDASKELLLSYVPMELGLPKDAQEKAIGELMRDVTSSLPQGGFKAYLLQPRQALTMQGLIEQVLQADGVTPEMMKDQRDRVKLVETFMQSPPDLLPQLVQQHDAKIDAQFIQTMTLVIQQLLGEGREQVAEQVAYIQNQIVELSTFGKQLMEQSQAQEAVIAEVADAVNALGQGANRADFLQLAISYNGDEQRLQALVGLIRPVFDYTFFEEMTAYIGQAPADDRADLEKLRDALAQLTAMIDQQAQAALQEAVGLLRVIVASPNPDEVIQANLPMIDNTFLQVLSANIQEVTRRGDINASAKLKDVYNRIVAALQASMPPELQFINQLLNAPNEDEVRSLISQHASEFGASLLGAIDAVEQQIAGQGDPAVMQRFDFVRREATQALA